LIQKVKEKGETLKDYNAAYSFYKFKFLPCKYIRKFVFDTMISESLNVPESVVDFIEGRTPKIGARHYSRLLTQADCHYPKYATYISELRKTAGYQPLLP